MSELNPEGEVFFVVEQIEGANAPKSQVFSDRDEASKYFADKLTIYAENQVESKTHIVLLVTRVGNIQNFGSQNGVVQIGTPIERIGERILYPKPIENLESVESTSS